MKPTFISKEDNNVKFEIEFTAEELENALINAYKVNKDQFQIDGFRKGKAPRKIIEQHYGKNVFDSDAIDTMLQDKYPMALIELDIDPIDKPEIDIPEIVHGQDIKISVAVPVVPEVEVKDYAGVQVDKVEYIATEDDVEAQLTQAQERNARLVEKDKEAEDGDTVNIDYAGFLGDEQFEGGTDNGHNLKLGSQSFINGFEEQLVGKKAGDVAEVKVTFPEEYHSEALAGQDAVFQVKVNSVRATEKPELNDEFAQDLSEFETMDELRADIKKKLDENNVTRGEMEMKDNILQKIFEANDVDVPEVMVDSQLEEMLKEFERELKQQGIKLEQYFQLTQQNPADVREQIKGDAYNRVKMRLLVNAIARKEAFEVSDEEIQVELDRMAEAYNMDKEKMRDVLGEFQMKMLRDDIKNKKAVDFIYENAIVTDAPKAEAKEEAEEEK